MNGKIKNDRLFLLFVPAVVLLLLLSVTLSAYHSSFTNEKAWTTQYFEMLADNCSKQAQTQTQLMRSQTEQLGAMISSSSLAYNTMDSDFNSVFKNSSAQNGLVIANGTLVYGTQSIYDSFADFASQVSTASGTLISDAIQCTDGNYRVAVGTPVTMSYGAHVNVFLVYPMSVLDSVTGIKKIETEGDLYLLRSDGYVMTDRTAISRHTDERNYCSPELLAKATQGLSEFKDYFSGKKYLCYAMDTGVNNWYAYCAVSVNSVRQRTSSSIGIFFRIIMVILVLLVAIFLYYYYRNNARNRGQFLDRQKFEIAARQSSRAVFQYDIEKDVFRLINDCAKISLPGGVSSLSRDIVISNVYDEDVPELQSMISTLRESNTASATVRACYFCGDGSFHWYYVTATRLAQKGFGSNIVIGIIEDIDEREKERIDLLKKATTDSLTGINNRAETTRLINERLSDPPADKTSAFIIFDLDNFKNINDTHGHDMGDKVLRFFADKLKYTFRAEDVVGRLGGDEFVVYMSFQADEGFVKRRFASFAESITRRRIDDDLPYISCSAGYVTSRPGEDFEDVYKRADKALYRAKTIGKNCVVCGD